MKGFKLVRHDWDNYENRNAACCEDLGIFVDDDSKTAYAKVEEFLKAMGPQQIYIGWNDQIYPQFTVERIDIV